MKWLWGCGDCRNRSKPDLNYALWNPYWNFWVHFQIEGLWMYISEEFYIEKLISCAPRLFIVTQLRSLRHLESTCFVLDKEWNTHLSFLKLLKWLLYCGLWHCNCGCCYNCVIVYLKLILITVFLIWYLSL